MLHTERLTLRGWREDDAEAYAAIHAEPEVAYWLGGRLTLAQALASFGTLKRRVDEDGWGMLAVERKETAPCSG
jgi:ribosomal-protein-alanine N-acetyltransferase